MNTADKSNLIQFPSKLVEPVRQPLDDSSWVPQDLLEKVGARFSINRAKITVEQARRRGLAVVTAGTLAVGALITPTLAGQFNYIEGSNIPTSEKQYDHKKDVPIKIPPFGAFDLAKKVDPGHDPRNGVENFTEQLGHDPQPGDQVIIPLRPAK